ncbi:MAG: hypothetical protein E6I60_04805 [Chloroflexi bacterium]|nr:MAG: hypothetical protein E6I60_04805 [Chloroflexota bacterium]
MEVQLAVSGGDQLGQRFPDPTGAAEPVQGQPGRHEQATDAWHRPQQRIGVGGHGIRMADEFHDPRLADEGKPPCRALEERLEPVLVGSDGGPGVLPGNAVDPSGVGVQLVAAQHDASGLGLPIDEVVRVAKAGHVVRELGAPDRLQRGVLVIDRCGHDNGSGHGGDLWRPDAARDHHHLGLDPARLRLHRVHRSRPGQLDPRHPGIRQHLHSELTRGLGQRKGRRMRIDGPVPRQPDRPEQRIPADGGHQLRGVLARNQLDIQSDRPGAAHAPLLLQQLLATGGEAQAAHRVEDAQPAVKLDAVAAESHHRGGGIELGDQSCRMTGRAAGQVGFLQQHRVPPSSLRQVVGNARAGDPAPNHDGARTAR